MAGYDSDLEYLDGPGFADWLYERFRFDRMDLTAMDPNLHRSISNWRRGQAATLWHADEILIRYGAHPNEIPAQLFIEAPTPRRHKRRFTDDQRRSILDYARRNGIGSACKRYGVTDKTLRNWKRRVAHA